MLLSSDLSLLMKILMGFVMTTTIVWVSTMNVGCATGLGQSTSVDARSVCNVVIDFLQGYSATVLIGDQCWFAENLRNELYNNGDTIPSGLSDSDWETTTSGAVAVYGEGSSDCYPHSSPDGDPCDDTWSLNEYGRLYNWHAVDDARGLCPSGWHVPTDEDCTVMTDHLGGESIAGGQMMADYGWSDGGIGTNSSGFSFLPGGLL